MAALHTPAGADGKEVMNCGVRFGAPTTGSPAHHRAYARICRSAPCGPTVPLSRCDALAISLSDAAQAPSYDTMK
jgi:hypothetical protein